MGYTKKQHLNDLKANYDIMYCYKISGVRNSIIAYLRFKDTYLTPKELVIQKLQAIYSLPFNIEYIELKVSKGKNFIFKRINL